MYELFTLESWRGWRREGSTRNERITEVKRRAKNTKGIAPDLKVMTPEMTVKKREKAGRNPSTRRKDTTQHPTVNKRNMIKLTIIKNQVLIHTITKGITKNSLNQLLIIMVHVVIMYCGIGF